MNTSQRPFLELLGHSLLSSLTFVLLAGLAIALDIFAAQAVRWGASAETAHLIELGALWMLRIDLALGAALLIKGAAQFIKGLLA